MDDGPPQAAAGDEVARMLEVQQGVLMRERRIVDPRDVPDEVRAEPERQGDERVRQCPDSQCLLEASRGRCRETENRERRSPLCDDDVLEEVCKDEITHGDGVHRCCEHAQQKKL